MNMINRASVFGRGAVRLQARPGEFLDLDTIRAHAPAIFAEEPHSSRSERFVHIPTHEMLGALMKEGFRVTGVSVGGSKDAEKRAFTKHMIRLRRENNVKSVGDTFPEVVLKNAHDGTSQYHLMMGLFRLVCLNGLVVSESLFGDVKVPHRSNAIDKVIEGSYEVLQHSDEVIDQVEQMKAIELNVDEKRAFAKAAIQLRFDEVPADLWPLQVLNPRRRADNLDDLWTVYNRAQENLIKGGLNYTATEKDNPGVRRHMSTRAVQSVDGDIKLNRALWTLAEEMKALKA
jgi:hypothetical protein